MGIQDPVHGHGVQASDHCAGGRNRVWKNHTGNNNVHLLCARQRPERSHYTY